MRLWIAAAVASLALSCVWALPASAAEVVLLATRSVPDHSDTDTVELPGGKAFWEVRLCVANRSVNFHDVDIYFANGGQQDVELRAVVPAGECTRWIDLAGDSRRNLTRIVMRYDAVSGGAQAVVSVYGRF